MNRNEILPEDTSEVYRDEYGWTIDGDPCPHWKKSLVTILLDGHHALACHDCEKAWRTDLWMTETPPIDKVYDHVGRYEEPAPEEDDEQLPAMVMISCPDCGKKRRVSRYRRDAMRRGKESMRCQSCGVRHWHKNRGTEYLVGEDRWNSRLTEKDVINIRQRAKNGVSYCSMAKEYKVSANSIRKAAVGETWAHVKEGL